MLPIAVRPDGRRAVIVGGGDVALRKAETLAAAGFQLVVVAPAIDARLRAALEAWGGGAAERAYEAGDLTGAFLAIAATNDDAVNERVVADAKAAGILVCDAGSPERGDFTMPATVRNGSLTFTVDTGGGAPAFSKRIARSRRRSAPTTQPRRARSRSCEPMRKRRWNRPSAPASCARSPICRSASSPA